MKTLIARLWEARHAGVKVAALLAKLAHVSKPVILIIEVISMFLAGLHLAHATIVIHFGA